MASCSSNGELFNPQAKSASELYRASFAVNGRNPSRRALRRRPPSPTPRCPETLRLLHRFLSPFRGMTALFDRIVGVSAGVRSREAIPVSWRIQIQMLDQG